MSQPLALSFELGLKKTNPPTGGIQKGEYGVVPLMAGQMPVVVVPGGERQVDRHRHGPSAYGGGGPAPLGRRRFQYIFRVFTELVRLVSSNFSFDLCASSPLGC